MFCIFVGYFSDFAFPHTDEGGCFSIKECFDGCGSQCGSKDGVFGAWLAASLDEAQDKRSDVDVSAFLEPFARALPSSAPSAQMMMLFVLPSSISSFEVFAGSRG